MKENYIDLVLKKFPNIAGGRKNFKYFDFRIKKSLILTREYKKKIQIQNKLKQPF